jgi:hypothetical protein
MRRVILLLMLSLVLGQAAGLDRVLGEDACAQDCPDDAQGRKCPPLCPNCACSVQPAPILPGSALAVVLLPTRSAIVFSEAYRRPATPEPREILHVPIAFLV